MQLLRLYFYSLTHFPPKFIVLRIIKPYDVFPRKLNSTNVIGKLSLNTALPKNIVKTYCGKFSDESTKMRFLSLIFLCCCCCASENANEQLMICKPATSVFSIQQTNSTNQHGCSSSSRPGNLRSYKVIKVTFTVVFLGCILFLGKIVLLGYFSVLLNTAKDVKGPQIDVLNIAKNNKGLGTIS